MREEAKAVLSALEHPDVHLNSTLWARFKDALVDYIHALEGEEKKVVADVEHLVGPHAGSATPAATSEAPAASTPATPATPPKEGE